MSYFKSSSANGAQSMIAPARPAPYRCEVFPERERVRIAPAGELDIATVPRLEDTIRELVDAGFDRVVLDLANVEFLDSTGLRLILQWHASAERDRLRFEVWPGPPAVQKLFTLTGADELVGLESRSPRAGSMTTA
jgi:anti-sigma B factor antagonist